MIEDKIKAALQEAFKEGKNEIGNMKYKIMWFALASKLKSIMNQDFCLRCGKKTDSVIYCDNCKNDIYFCDECGLETQAPGLCHKCQKAQDDFIEDVKIYHQNCADFDNGELKFDDFIWKNSGR